MFVENPCALGKLIMGNIVMLKVCTQACHAIIPQKQQQKKQLLLFLQLHQQQPVLLLQLHQQQLHNQVEQIFVHVSIDGKFMLMT